jgi:hypothetical protein
MSERISLKELERKAWRSFFQDGLWDIYLGLLLLGMGSGRLARYIGLPEESGWSLLPNLAMSIVSMIFLWAGKRYITVPRMGRVKVGQKGKARKRKARILLTASVLVGAVLFVVALVVPGNAPGRRNLAIVFPAVYVLNMLVIFSLGAHFLDFSRLYLIGVMYALPVPLDIALEEFAGIDLGFAVFAAPAAVILLIGTVLFIRFLRDYPVPAQGPSTGGVVDGNR